MISAYMMPHRDVGVVSIESPIDGCAQEIGDYVVITIRITGSIP